MTTTPSRRPVRMLATLVVFTGFAGQFWRNLLDWWGFGIIAGLAIAASIVAIAMLKPRIEWRGIPKSLAAFIVLCVLSIAWSFYPGASAIGVAIQLLTTASAVFGLCLSAAEFVRVLGSAFRWILGLSLLFEVWVAVFVGGPVLPFWVEYEGKIPLAFYWSRGLLLHGGPIEGIVANRNLLGFIALLAVVVFCVQLADRTVRRGWGVFWIVVATGTLVLTRSATVILAAAAVAIVLAFALWTRSRSPERRRPVYLTAAAVVVVGIGAVTAFGDRIIGIFGKSSDLTGRSDIWNAVIDLAQQRPVFGWGWVSYWAPWVEPFQNLAVRKGVVYLQAHNAWLDVWLQVGIVGVILFAALVISTGWRSWFLAVDRPRFGLPDREPFTASALLPILLLAALVAQSLAESRILIEGGWVVLVALSLMTKRSPASLGLEPARAVEQHGEPRRG